MHRDGKIFTPVWLTPYLGGLSSSLFGLELVFPLHRDFTRRIASHALGSLLPPGVERCKFGTWLYTFENFLLYAPSKLFICPLKTMDFTWNVPSFYTIWICNFCPKILYSNFINHKSKDSIRHKTKSERNSNTHWNYFSGNLHYSTCVSLYQQAKPGCQIRNPFPLLPVTLWLVLLNLYVEHQLLPAVYVAFIPFWILIIGLLYGVTKEIVVVNA